MADQDKRNAVELDAAKAATETQKDFAAKDSQSQELKAKLEAGEAACKLAVSEAICDVEKERDTLATKLELAKQDKRNALEFAQALGRRITPAHGGRREQRLLWRDCFAEVAIVLPHQFLEWPVAILLHQNSVAIIWSVNGRK